MSETKKTRQTIKGTVVSDKMNKTRVVEVRRHVKHGLYQKGVLRRARFFIHDEKNETKVGDLVIASSTRPMSKNKHFTLVKVVEKRVSQ